VPRLFAQHREERSRRSGAFAHGGCKLAQEQDLRRFAGVIGGLPGPRAFGVRTAKRSDHGRAKRVRIDRAAAFEIGQEQFGGGKERNAGIR
jgi:hypothetical protein